MNLSFIIFVNISSHSKTKIYTDPISLPFQKVGVVLGCSKHLKNKQKNLYFEYRVQAAADLFFNGKIEYILVSGDNSRKNYDEPTDMKNALIQLNVPADKIYCDYAGFSTWDTIIRAKKVFQLNSFTLISQNFHLERALYIAEKHDVKAIGYCAKDVKKYSGLKTKSRELLSRSYLILALTFNFQPKFLGPPISIGTKPSK